MKKPNIGHMGITPTFKSKKDQRSFIEDWNNSDVMKNIFKKDSIFGSYDFKKFNFQNIIIKELLDLKIVTPESFKEINSDLANLHKIISEEDKKIDDNEINNISKQFYKNDKSLLKMYKSFLQEVIAPLFSDRIYFQKQPTIRFNFPSSQPFKYNKRFHSDIMLGHPPKEVNLWFGLTDAFSSNSLRFINLEKSKLFFDECKNSYDILAERVQYDEEFKKKLDLKSHSIDLKCGQYFLFDSRCLHCTQRNTTNKTRISIDIRVIQDVDYRSLSRKYTGTGRKKSEFKPGDYYHSKRLKL
jgi:ectoine hydroxylase-related dioxygenase (phytanoyl-CoA dioxygenase family)